MGKKSTCFKIFFLPKQCIMKAVTEVLFMLVSSILVVYYRWCLEGEQEGRHIAILTFLSYSFLNSFKPLASATYCVNVLDSSIMSEYNNNNNNKTNTCFTLLVLNVKWKCHWMPSSFRVVKKDTENSLRL